MQIFCVTKCLLENKKFKNTFCGSYTLMHKTVNASINIPRKLASLSVWGI